MVISKKITKIEARPSCPKCRGLLVLEKEDEFYCIRCVNCGGRTYPPHIEETQIDSQ